MVIFLSKSKMPLASVSRSTQSLLTGARVRWASGWLGGLLGRIRTSPETDHDTTTTTITTNSDQDQDLLISISPEDALKKIAQEHIPGAVGDGDSVSWKEAGLGNSDVKSKILYSFESTFKQDISSKELASISTFADLLKILNTSQSRQETCRVFPNIKDDGSLPPNLSIQFINTAPRPKPDRKPFQNYDARRPEHANFLTKQQKEKRKQKRRHLTAWK